MKKIKDKIIIANTVSLVFISFIIILSMTIFLIHTAVEAETKEMDKLLPTVIKRLDEVPDYKLKETYKNYDYADKEYKYIILDDDDDMLSEQFEYFIKTKFNGKSTSDEGLNKDILNKAILLLEG